MARPWAGARRVRLIRATLATKGTVCHLCGYDGSTSADHEPPRSVLLAEGLANPDQLRYLFPAHLSCNIRRKARAITDELRAELARRYQADQRRDPAARRSSRFAGGPA